METIRVLFTIALQKNLKVHHLDVTTAFLNGEIDTEIYMKQPKGFSTSSKVCRMVKSIYGLKINLECNPNLVSKGPGLTEPRTNRHQTISGK